VGEEHDPRTADPDAVDQRDVRPRISPAADPSAPPKPLLKTSTAGLPVSRASLCSRSRYSSVLPDRIGEPQAPVPYSSSAAFAAATTSGCRTRPRYPYEVMLITRCGPASVISRPVGPAGPHSSGS
jgi:hypothetical protein